MENKDLFIETIKLMHKYDQLTAKFCSVLEEMSPGCYCTALVYQEHNELLFKFLKEYYKFNDAEMEIIYFFICDLEYGEKWTEDSITDQDNKPIDISTIEKLWEDLRGE